MNFIDLSGYLPYLMLKYLFLYLQSGPESLALLTLECMPTLSHCLPPELVGTVGTGAEGCIVLAFAPQYQAAWRALYQQVCRYVVIRPCIIQGYIDSVVIVATHCQTTQKLLKLESKGLAVGWFSQV